MAPVNKIDSNVTGLRYCVETALGVAGSTWFPLDPNSYADFGGSFTKIARNTINNKRSRYKGVLTDQDSSGGFNIDMTQDNIQALFPGFMFAVFDEKGKEASTAVSGTAYTVGDSGDFLANDLVFASGFAVEANNGLKLVTGIPNGTSVAVSGLSAEASPPAAAQIVRVGHQFASGDLEVDASGALPTLTTSAKDLTALGLTDGEMVFVGGDTAATEFGTAANNGWLRVRETNDANTVTIDKSSAVMVTDAGAGKTMQMFFGRTLKNEEGSAITRTTYQLERTLGAADDAAPADIQSEYVVGAIPNELTMAVDTADKVMVDMGFIGTSYEPRSGTDGVKAGTRPALISGSAFNTSTHMTRIRMGLASSTDAFPDAMFAYVTELRVSINNNISLTKAIGTLGAFDATAGTFEVGGNVTAYFQSTDALEALRDNADVTFDVCAVKENAGFSIDMPLLTLDDGRLNVELNQSVTIPLGIMAADGGDIDAALGHTLMISFYDYLPDAAEA